MSLKDEYPNLHVTATYSPEDNKIRLSASQRLDKELYLRVKAAGFSWAPKQEIFVAPKWTPSREDLAIELAGEIDDEDTSLVDRAEQRAERFEEYGEKRAADADRARRHVDSIADGIPMGQPILVGHHSERHARRDAEKIENGMRRAIKMWETSKYWEQRAAGAVASAKYKERPDVRARRIKTIEAELRSAIADFTPVPSVANIMQQRWNAERDAPEELHAWVGPKGRGGRWVPVACLPRMEASAQRWIQHYENRLVYERAMLAEGGRLKADAFDIQVGGRVLRRGQWMIVTKLNNKDGVLFSVSVIGHWATTIPVEEIKDYRAPAEGDAEKIKAATKAAPLCNFLKDGCKEMTLAEWKRLTRCSQSAYVHTFAATDQHGAYRLRTLHRWDKPTGNQTCEQPGRQPVFITDAPAKQPPAAGTAKPAAEDGAYANRKAVVAAVREAVVSVDPAPVEDLKGRNPAWEGSYTVAKEHDPFENMKQILAGGGVKVVSAPQLFPTPTQLATRMVDIADIQPGDDVLEPSAGTGRILDALQPVSPQIGRLVAVELNHDLASGLERSYGIVVDVHQGDFLECSPDTLGRFDVILMNPPFANADDIKHIQHAMTFLKPGGRLVAVCANGPRQNDRLKPIIEECGEWEDLPAGTFKSSGTGVNTALLTFIMAADEQEPPIETVEQVNVVQMPMPTRQTSLFDVLSSEGYL